MLIVSNVNLTENNGAMKPTRFLNSSVRDYVLNINNDYRYMKMGYYVSLHAEVLGNPVVPRSENAIDAYRHPILLIKAAKHGIPTLPYMVTDSAQQLIKKFGFPMVIFAVNPFSNGGYRIANNETALYRALKSFGLNHKFTVCAQTFRGKMVSVKAVFGKSGCHGLPEEISKRFYEVFKLPICRLHIQECDGKAYLCGIQKIEVEELTPVDLKLISEEIAQISKIGEKYWLR
ncbi:MAG: RimK-like ATPgrasp N-terminal domain-containing protein [Candidatus Bathyarchaeia archaeon]